MVFFFFLGLFKKRVINKTEKENVSVIIAARNEEDTIENCLGCLVKQTYPEVLYEVIVVDDGSTDKTNQRVKKYSERYKNIYLYKLENYVPGFSPKKQALNLGISKSKGDIILTTDADCEMGEKWIESMQSNFSRDIGVVAGFSEVKRDGRKKILNILQRSDFLSLMSAAAGSINLGIPFAVSGQNLGYRKQAFLDVNGFKDIFDKVSGDDTLLMQLIRKKTNWKVAFNSQPQSFVKTRGEDKFSCFLNQRQRWASNSKTQFFLNKGFFFYLVDVLLFNFCLFSGIVLSFLFNGITFYIILFLLLKFIVEYPVVIKAVRLFRVRDLLKYFPLWFLFEIPYIVYMGFAGNFGKINWKNREYSI